MEGEESTFYEAKKKFKEVCGRLGNGRDSVDDGGKDSGRGSVDIGKDSVDGKYPILTPIVLSPPYSLPPYSSPPVDENILWDRILNFLSLLCPCINTMAYSKSKVEVLCRTIHSTTKDLRDSNNVLLRVFQRMDSVCKEIVLNNSNLRDIVQQILLKFSEAGDFLDLEQTETTINTLFEMSKLILKYKSKVEGMNKDRVEINREDLFPFYYPEEEELEIDSFFEPVEIKSVGNGEGNESPYTEWTTWIETYNNCNVVNNCNGVEIHNAVNNNVVEHSSLENHYNNNSHNTPEIHNYTQYNTQEIIQILNLKTVPFSFLPQKVRKIGEATFSEVFKHKNSVYKVVPLEGEDDLRAFVREAFVHKTLSGEVGVCPLQDCLMVEGGYTKGWLKAWDAYGKEENERPSKDDKTYGVLVMDYGGVPLDKVQFRKNTNIVSMIKSLCTNLYNLENKYQFEHRDLHWGNLLILKKNISLIDFTLSRIKIKKIVYNDLNKYKWLFEGDSTVDEQYEVYRKLLKLSGGDWKGFYANSNYCWIIYLVEKFFNKIKEIRSITNKEKEFIKVLKECSNLKELMGYIRE